MDERRRHRRIGTKWKGGHGDRKVKVPWTDERASVPTKKMSNRTARGGSTLWGVECSGRCTLVKKQKRGIRRGRDPGPKGGGSEEGPRISELEFTSFKGEKGLTQSRAEKNI